MQIDDMAPYQLCDNLECLVQWLDFIDIGNKSMDKHSHITMQNSTYMTSYLKPKVLLYRWRAALLL